MADDLPSKIQGHLNDELEGDEVEYICSILKTDSETKFGRKILEGIGRNPLKLFDVLSRRGKIDIHRHDYSLLLRILKKAKLDECSKELEEIIRNHQEPQQQSYQESCRPASLPVPAKRISSPNDEFLSPSSHTADRRKRLKSTPSSGSMESLLPDHLTTYQHYLSKPDIHHYSFDENQKGLVVIINNFSNRKTDGELFRHGTQEDEDAICKLFKSPEFLHYYDVEEPHKNLPYHEFDALLDHYSKRLMTENCNSFFMFILSHGDEEGVKTYFTDPKNPPEHHAISVDKITAKFSNSLKDRPKVFFIQACQGRGDNRESVTPDAVPDDSQHPEDGGIEPVESDEIVLDTGGPPKASDMLTAFATVKGYRSYRRIGGAGSWFIQKLIKEIEAAHKQQLYSTHLVDLLTEVQRKVAIKVGKSVASDGIRNGEKVVVKQMPCFQSSLRKKFFLLPTNLPY